VAVTLLGARQKWNHARLQQEALANAGHQRAYPITAKAYRNGLEYRFHVGEIPTFDAVEVALATGDCLFNLRAALDHIVYALHVRRYEGKVPREVEWVTQFPILTTEPPLTAPKRKRSTDTKTWREIANLRREQRRAIRFLQPYNGRDDKFYGVRWALGHIARLNNIDKHRHLHVVRRGVIAIRQPRFPPEYGFRQETFWVTLKSQTEVQRWTFDKVPPNIAEEIKKQNEVEADVLLDEGSNRFQLFPFLYSLVNNVDTVIHRFGTFLPLY
jgi:hypothetical protein